MRRVAVWVVAALVFVVAAGNRDFPLAFAAAAAAVAFTRRNATRSAFFKSWRPAPRLFVLLTAAGLALEFAAWLGSYLLREPQPKLMHPQLVPDLALAMGFYGGMAAGWTLLALRFRQSPMETAVLYGVAGILLEQQGAVLTSAARYFGTVPFSVLWMVGRVGFVYGAIGLLATALARPDLPGGERRGLLRIPAALAGLVVGAYAGTAIVTLAASAMGGFPPRRPIVDHPFV